MIAIAETPGSMTRPAVWEQRSRWICLFAALLPVAPTRADDWPQWRGPERGNISKEAGLLKEWPERGPPLLWKAVGLGEGVASVAVASGQRERKRQPTGGVFVPTPSDIVDKMLEMARVKKGELVCDLGCGDARILVAAAKKYQARGYGIDIDPECVKLARAAVAEARVEKLVIIEQGDLLDADFSKADVVTLYLLPAIMEKLIPKLEKLKPGTRIVSHAFRIPGLEPDKVISVTSTEDEQERKLYLWRLPLKKKR
jgi:SAM-dependent methyltransferase